MRPNVPLTIASDMHLRPDRPERGRRLARLVDALDAGESLLLDGDVCDFWFASRGSRRDGLPCEGLRSLARFTARGGDLTVILGNHDLWLADYYRWRLGATVATEPVLEFESHGLRVHVVHGHLLGGRPWWKGVLESRAFWHAFGALPHPLAAGLATLLEHSNGARVEADNRRHLAVYRAYAASLPESVDLLVFGHTHITLDDASRRPRMVVLGDWKEQASYLRIDAQGARHVIVPDGARERDIEAAR